MTFKAYSRRLEDSGAIICPDNINPKKKKKKKDLRGGGGGGDGGFRASC